MRLRVEKIFWIRELFFISCLEIIRDGEFIRLIGFIGSVCVMFLEEGVGFLILFFKDFEGLVFYKV